MLFFGSFTQSKLPLKMRARLVLLVSIKFNRNIKNKRGRQVSSLLIYKYAVDVFKVRFRKAGKGLQ